MRNGSASRNPAVWRGLSEDIGILKDHLRLTAEGVRKASGIQGENIEAFLPTSTFPR